MNILYLEDNPVARKNIADFNAGRHKIDFVDKITALNEILYDEEGYKEYGAVVLDLSINMPLLTRAQIIKRIPLLNKPDVPTTCSDIDIPLYGLDYYRYVIAKRLETRKMVMEGRIILFTGHAQKIRNKGLYNEKDNDFITTKLIDRAARNATSDLFIEFMNIQEKTLI